MKLPLTAIILTGNEEHNLSKCLDSIVNYVDQIIIVDCFSTDKTKEIASEYTDLFYQNKWINYSKQYIWAINNTPIRNEWILRIDADERWTNDGFVELSDIIETDRADGVYVKMKIFFMDRWIRHGGNYPNYFLRVYKRNNGVMEDRWMDEHIKVDGRSFVSSIDVIEANYDRQRDISLWTNKHNGYSTRESVEILIQKYRIGDVETIAQLLGGKTERKRWLKENIYFCLPLFVRPFLYYVYRYIFKLGFLDGKEGFIYHYLHAFWYRFLVDVKVCQLERNAKVDNICIKLAIKKYYDIEI
jgi:glycosyltransferase involved in cell wall biosynthesis